MVGGAIFALGIWQFVVWHFELPPILLPSPSQVLAAGIEERESLMRGTFVTGLAAVLGLATAVVMGGLIAILFSISTLMRRAFFPYVVLLQTVPIVAIAPLLIVWSGYQFRTVVIVTVIICLFPIVNSVTDGLLTIPRELDDLFKLYRASRFKRLLSLQMPSAVPNLILGMKTSSGLAVIGAIVAEFFVGNGSSYDGLGTLMMGWQGRQRIAALIAAIFASTLLGLLLYATIERSSKWLLGRYFK